MFGWQINGCSIASPDNHHVLSGDRFENDGMPPARLR
jgi:hypothetical protein